MRWPRTGSRIADGMIALASLRWRLRPGVNRVSRCVRLLQVIRVDTAMPAMRFGLPPRPGTGEAEIDQHQLTEKVGLSAPRAVPVSKCETPIILVHNQRDTVAADIVCTDRLTGIVLALDRLRAAADAVQPVFITVDPERDTPLLPEPNKSDRVRCFISLEPFQNRSGAPQGSKGSVPPVSGSSSMAALIA